MYTNMRNISLLLLTIMQIYLLQIWLHPRSFLSVTQPHTFQFTLFQVDLMRIVSSEIDSLNISCSFTAFLHMLTAHTELVLDKVHVQCLHMLVFTAVLSLPLCWLFTTSAASRTNWSWRQVESLCSNQSCSWRGCRPH